VPKLLAYRLLQFPLILAVIYVVTLALAWVAPGSPFEGERNLNPQALRQLKERFNADSFTGFLTYYPVQIVTKLDFGPAMSLPGQQVSDLIGERLPRSMALGAVALAFATLVGTFIGTLAAVYRGRTFDWLSLVFTLVGISLPGFVVAGVLSMVFIAFLRWFTPGWGDDLSQLVLPALALSLAPMAYITRLTRVSMLDVLGADYVRTARAKGCSKPVVVFKHCLRNAFLPVFSYLGPAAAATLTGSFVVEQIFNIPGMGQLFVLSVQNRDQTLILGTVMIYSVLLLTFNLLVDLGYSFIDPRIDLSAKGS
jgi:oligopeptide transport system permease protein